MAKTFDELIENLNTLETELKTQLPKIVLEYAQNAVALGWKRVEEEGAKPGAKYSTEPMYAAESIFNRKSAFKPQGKHGFTGERVVESQKISINKKTGKVRQGRKEFKVVKTKPRSMYLPEGYEELRQIQGLPVNVVNLEYSGRLHQNVRPLNVEDNGEGKVVAFVGATTEEEKKKLAGNAKRYGNFLSPTPEIAAIINVVPQKIILEIVKQTLG